MEGSLFEPEIFNYLENDNSILERRPLEILAKTDQLNAYKHEGFGIAWIQRDKDRLERFGILKIPWLNKEKIVVIGGTGLLVKMFKRAVSNGLKVDSLSLDIKNNKKDIGC